jgi:GT2 family glycosyltransferase/glycosyltransferase involved in cell wall biosynthesis
VDTNLKLTGQARTGGKLRVVIAGVDVTPSMIRSNNDGFDSFALDVPAGIRGGLSVSLGNARLLGEPVSWPPQFGLSGWVAAKNGALVGKVRMDWAPALPIPLTIGRDSVRQLLVTPVDDTVATPFSVSLGENAGDASGLEVYARLPDGSCSSLVGSPISVHRAPIEIVEVRASLARADPDVGNGLKNRKIDVVIPVYAGVPETLDCIESVLATTSRDEVELVVVNDGSPDPVLRDALVRFAKDGRITLLTHQVNLGFPASANRGMNLHPDRDIVLLNSDAELFGDWLERLRFAAYCQDDIGTVTPLGESASIVSYPGTAAHTHSRDEASRVDRIAREVNAGKVIELPVGVGFCLYIKRTCLSQVGLFDELSFDKGYGEENDFCLRARTMGWRHVAAANLFVRHRGARSFGRLKATLMERNRHVLNALHPGYDEMISDVVAADPLLEPRRAIDMHLAKTAKDSVLLVTGNLSGGVKRHVESRQRELLAQGRSALVLQPSAVAGRPTQAKLSLSDRQVENLIFNLPEDLPVLTGFLRELAPESIELHHFMGLPSCVLDVVTGLGSRYDIYVHDYSWICPRVNLSKGDGIYCREPEISECEACIRKYGTALEKSLTVESLRMRSARIMDGARAVIVPSHDVRIRLARYFPDNPVKVSPWEAPVHAAPTARAALSGQVRVAVIGAISVQKGYGVLLECARDAAARQIGLEFVVVGYTCGDEALMATGRVFITGPYADNEVAELLAREQCHIALFPSVVPETWCFALSHALTHGLPVVAFDLGAIAERLRDNDRAELLPLSAPAAAINDALLNAARRDAALESQKESVMVTTSITNSQPAADGFSTSLQFLPLPVGTYVFTVNGDTPSTIAEDEFALPAVQIGVAPARSEGSVEFLCRAATTDRWLAGSRDMIIAKITGGSVTLMLTSVRLPDNPFLAIKILRLNADLFQASGDSNSDKEPASESANSSPAQIVAHIHRIGDVLFNDGWAGCMGDGLWIEAFAIGQAGPLEPDRIEYCGVTADGFQTPWLGNRTLCGSRGRAVPMLGFAIRLKPDAGTQYDCQYTGYFVSGKVLGPFRNGDLCSSDLPRDPLWGIEFSLTGRAQPEGANPESTTA